MSAGETKTCLANAKKSTSVTVASMNRKLEKQEIAYELNEYKRRAALGTHNTKYAFVYFVVWDKRYTEEHPNPDPPFFHPFLPPAKTKTSTWWFQKLPTYPLPPLPPLPPSLVWL